MVEFGLSMDFCPLMKISVFLEKSRVTTAKEIPDLAGF